MYFSMSLWPKGTLFLAGKYFSSFPRSPTPVPISARFHYTFLNVWGPPAWAKFSIPYRNDVHVVSGCFGNDSDLQEALISLSVCNQSLVI